MTRYFIAPLLILGLLASPALAEEPAYVTTRTLGMETAQQLALASSLACRKLGYQVTVTVVDRNGNLLAMVRDPLSGTHTIDISRLKAMTAATFQTATISMDDLPELRDAPGVLLIGGGVPVQVGGHFYGAVGVSGAPKRKVTGDIDDECARTGIGAISETLEFAE
ncbi:MAG: heme-binding protein [Proteobacteria bacterium]|jgi:uncharacterized protein GlcG (DUF336 family)|nr:heme-binding protein [Pseudomonadota bacterium]